jgi:hypothetical protein
VDTFHLRNRHLVRLEVEVGYALAEDVNEEVVGELVLVGKAGSRDGLKLGNKGLVGLMATDDGVERVVGEFIVVAVVAVGCGALGKVAEIGLLLLFEKRVLGGEAVGDRLEVLADDSSGKGDYQKKILLKAHGLCSAPEREQTPSQVAELEEHRRKRHTLNTAILETTRQITHSRNLDNPIPPR